MEQADWVVIGLALAAVAFGLAAVIGAWRRLRLDEAIHDIKG